MKLPPFVSLVAVVGLTSCTTAHDAAVSTFRVLDAPHAYVRRQLGMDENGQVVSTTTTTTETTYADTAPATASATTGPQPFTTQSAPANPPPVQTQRRVAVQEQEPEPPAENATTPPPKKIVEKERSASTRAAEPRPSASPKVASTDNKTGGDLPYAKPVPGKPGYVFSPFDKNGGYVDVTGYSPGQKVKDPYSGKIFLVP